MTPIEQRRLSKISLSMDRIFLENETESLLGRRALTGKKPFALSGHSNNT